MACARNVDIVITRQCLNPTKALCIYTGAYAPCTRMCVYIYIYTRVCVRAHALVSRTCVCVCMYMYVCVCARVVSSFIRSLRDAQVFHDVGYWCSCTCSYLGSSHILTLSLVERKKKKKKNSLERKESARNFHFGRSQITRDYTGGDGR